MPMNATHSQAAQAEHEKRAAALSSVLAAVLLTGLKLAVGLATNSLGILSEAAHSGLDLVAAGVTYYAVRLSSQPADARHPYGHGKVENLSALIETLLLLLTCAWIVYEAVDRLIFHPQVVEASFWGAGVMVVSIAVDYTRSRMLMAAAKKHNSQALEADALHFSTDIWSSLVVLVGLGALALAETLHPASTLRPWLLRADSLAALAVSAIVVHVSWRLGKQAVHVLLDGAAEELTDEVERAVATLPGVAEVRRVRLRQSGPESFVDLRLFVPAGLDPVETHAVSGRAKEAVRALLPGADVLVEISPQADTARSVLEQVREISARRGLDVHDIELRQTPGALARHPGLAPESGPGLHLDLHAELPGLLSVAEAHERVTDLEEALLEGIEGLTSVVTHVEPEHQGHHEGEPESTGRSIAALSDTVRRVVHASAGDCGLHRLLVHRSGGRVLASFHCRMPAGTSVARAHDLTVAMENALRAELPELSRVTIHVEPQPAPGDVPRAEP